MEERVVALTYIASCRMPPPPHEKYSYRDNNNNGRRKWPVKSEIHNNYTVKFFGEDSGKKKTAIKRVFNSVFSRKSIVQRQKYDQRRIL